MTRNCANCAGPMPLESGRGRRRKYCETCKPSRPRRKPDPPEAVVRVVNADPGSVWKATRQALTEANALSHPMGQAAMVLARRLDDDREPVSALAQATKQLGAALSQVLASESKAAPADPNDEFTRKRLARESGA